MTSRPVRTSSATCPVDLERVGPAELGLADEPGRPRQRAASVEDSGMGDPLRFDAERLRILVERHLLFTGSDRARALLDDWDDALSRFVKVMPREYKRALLDQKAEAHRQSPPLPPSSVRTIAGAAIPTRRGPARPCRSALSQTPPYPTGRGPARPCRSALSQAPPYPTRHGPACPGHPSRHRTGRGGSIDPDHNHGTQDTRGAPRQPGSQQSGQAPSIGRPLPHGRFDDATAGQEQVDLNTD